MSINLLSLGNCLIPMRKRKENQREMNPGRRKAGTASRIEEEYRIKLGEVCPKTEKSPLILLD